MPPEEGAAVQPEESGQGEAAGSDLYQQVLGNIPEQHRETVEPHLKEWDSGVTERFQEAATLREQMEELQPYAELGLSEFDPAHVQEGLELVRMATQSPEEFEEFLINEAEARGLIEPEGEGDEDGDFDDEDGGAEGQIDPEAIQQIVAQTLDERLGPVEEKFNSMDEQERQSQAMEEIEGTLSDLYEEHGELAEEDERDVLLRARTYIEGGMEPSEALQKGHSDFLGLKGRIESSVFAQKQEQPETPETGGKPDTGAEAVTTFDDASKLARERLRNANAA